ncbi:MULTISPECIES: lactate/malate family dehydrogenase [unclassified Campylobacter]|uniref:lactate/malate family dehydrogenase n=1 Tax=unclassified Campylobacter TaxID=2593542 RepID=UPI003D32BFB3
MKISVIGAGNVGASTAYALAMRGVCDELAMVDIFGATAQSKAMDIAQSVHVFNKNLKVLGGDDYSLIANSDIVVMTAGSPRKPGQTREDLLLINAKVLDMAVKNIVKYAPNAFIVVVTNPLDVMVYLAYEFSGFAKNRIIGMAGELDSARLNYEISTLKGEFCSSSKVVGAHNDKMIISKNYLNTNLNNDEFAHIDSQTRNGGAKFVNLVGTSAFYAPAAGAVKICEAIKNDTNELQSVSIVLDGFACGRLAKIGKNGVGEVIGFNLADKENEALKASEAEIVQNIKFIKENL